MRPAARGAGLFGRQAPGATGTFLALVRAGAYNGTTFSKVLPGRWIQAGRQGSLRMGALTLPPDLPPNADLTAPRAFRRAARLAGSHARVRAGQQQGAARPRMRDACVSCADSAALRHGMRQPGSVQVLGQTRRLAAVRALHAGAP